MTTKYLIILVLVLASVCAEPEEERIVKGKPAAEGQFPHQAALFTNVGFCGAVIAGNYVISAAHCLDRARFGYVSYGSTYVYSRRYYQYFNYTAVRVHPLWSRQTLRNDIGCVRLSKELPITPLIKPVRLSCSLASCRVNERTIVTGFGKTSDNSSISRYLQYTELPIISKKYCDNYYGMRLLTGQYCVGTPNNSSACNGDSGSPGISSFTKALCGVVSFGSTSCTNGAPNVFTRISIYCDWINKNCN